MKKYLVGAILALTIALPIAVRADSTQTLLDAWKVVSGFILPRNAANGLKIPALSSTGNPCVTVGSTGAFATTTCSSGGSGVTTLATGTAGNIFNGSISGTTLTLNLPLASGSNTGQLQGSDWTIFNNKVSNSYASSTFPSLGYGTSTYATILNYPTYTYASSTFINYGYGTSTFATILNYPTYTYASSTFANYGYGTSTYATILNYPTYTYSSSTYISYGYGTSTYQPKISLTTTGSSGAATFSANVLNIPNYSGGGGGSGGGWATSSPYYITNTFGTAVGINSNTPTGNLVVEGISGSSTPIFVVATSTNSVILSVTSGGNVNIPSTTATALLGTDANKNLQSLTITNDTNVTGSVGLSALTLGWSGQLAAGRGGTGASSIPANTILIGNAGGTALTGSSLSQVAGTTLINGSTPIIDGGGDWLNNVIQTSGANFIVQSPTSTAALGNVVIGGGVQQLNATTYLSNTQFCSGGLFYISSSTAFNVYLPPLTQIGYGTAPSNCTTNMYAGSFSPQYITNFGTAGVTVNASGSGETLLFAPGSGPTLYSNQSWSQTGQFTASTTIVGATSTGMSLNTYYAAFQPTSTQPSIMGQILSADATGHGWQLTNLFAGSNITIATSTANQITLAVVASPTFTNITSTNASTTNLTVSNILNLSGQANGCEQVTNGVATSTGSSCGSGGSGNSAFTIGLNKIYNATSTDLVGIGTITPTTTLYVQGKGGTNPFVIASSTGTAMVTVAQNGDQTNTGHLLLGTGTDAAPAYSFANDTGGGMWLNGSTLQWDTSGSGRMSVDSVSLALQEPLRASDGTAGSPSISFNHSANAGLYYTNVANVIAMSTNSVQRMTWDASGNVGINSSTPNYILTVRGTTTLDSLDVSSSSGASILRVTSNSRFGINSSTPNAVVVLQGTTGSNNTTDILRVASSTGLTFLNVASTGFVGIGTTTAAGLLTVQGTSGSGQDLFDIASSTGALIFSVAPATSASMEIGTTTISGDLNIQDSTANATSTQTIGSPLSPACIKVYNTAGTAEYMVMVGTTWTVTSATCKSGF